jgi:hypothetical protein
MLIKRRYSNYLIIFFPKNVNFIKEFDRVDETAEWLRDQWAGLFADFLSKKAEQGNLKKLTTEFSELQEIISSLRTYTETILRTLEPDTPKKLILDQEKIGGQKN